MNNASGSETLSKFESPIFVVGLPRTGTSMVTGLISRCGAWTGNSFSNAANPQGFFENLAIKEQLLKPILRSMNCDPGGILKLPPLEITGSFSYTNSEGVKLDLQDLVRRVIHKDGYTGNMVWAFKDPKLSLIWKLFHDAFPGASWVIVRRRRESFVNSCLNTVFLKRHSTNPQFWEALADEYEKRLEKLRSQIANTFEVSADEIINGEFSEFKQMIEKVGLTFERNRVQKFVETQLWHY